MERARKAEDKERRRETFLVAAETLFADSSFGAVKMVDVARAAGMAKGSLFVYFPTKEHLFLDLLEAHLLEWLDVLGDELGAGGRWTEARLARIITDTLLERETLTRLLTILSSILEHNVTVERVLVFKQQLMGRLDQAGVVIEKRLDAPAGSGVRTLMHVYALIVGLRQMTDHSPIAAAALEHEELASLRFEFADELEHALVMMFRGVKQQ